MRRSELSQRTGVGAVAALIGVAFAGSTLLTPLYAIYKAEFGFSQITLTLVYAVYVVGNLVALLFFGRLSDLVGRRPAALCALAVAVVSTLIFLFAPNVASLFIARALSGLGIGIAAGSGTAWLAELIGTSDKSRSAMLATGTNYLGLALGALSAGVLAQCAFWPTQLPFVVYLAVLLVTAALIACTPDTVVDRRRVAELPLHPRLSVPRSIRNEFVAPAVAGFGAMALVGFYAALAPGILARSLHQTSYAVAGAIFFELALVAALMVVVTQRASSRAAMLWALALMIPSAALVVSAQVAGSMPLLLVATASCGVAASIGYRGSLQVVSQIAPADRRAEVTSAYFVCCFCGNALPVIGVAVIESFSSPEAASPVFAAMIIVFSVIALAFGLKYARPQSS